MLLKCKEVAQLASDYIDNDTTGHITWKMRLHLAMCTNCRRFIKHLRITKVVAIGLAQPGDEVDADDVLRRLHEKLKHSN